MTMDPGDSHFLLHYLTLRRSLGILGVLLPVILIFGDLAIGEGGGLQPSLSHYYDTIMVGVFVGVLFAIGVFLFSYRGYETPDKKPYELSDNVAGKVACVAALAVALFPTTATVAWVRTVHTIAAILFFATLAYFSIHLFTKTLPGMAPQGRKIARNRIYRVCGWAIIVFIVMIGINWLFLDDRLEDLRPVLWLESLALWAFGIAWFVKGRTLWKDSPPAQ